MLRVATTKPANKNQLSTQEDKETELVWEKRKNRKKDRAARIIT
jgi:hypothetical protein